MHLEIWIISTQDFSNETCIMYVEEIRLDYSKFSYKEITVVFFLSFSLLSFKETD